jgi:hypothetical protein
MNFTGNIFKSIPQTKYINFSFDNICVSNLTGIGEIGFSGTGFNSSFKFTSGKLYDPSNNYIYSYQQNSPFSLSGYIETGKSIVYLNNTRLKTKTLAQNEYNNFYINLTGINISTNVYLYEPKIIYSFPSNVYYLPNTSFNFNLTNQSNVDFKIYNSTIYFTDPLINFSGELSGNPTGIVLRNSASGLQLTDTSNILSDKSYEFSVFFDTNFGKIQQIFTGNRVSGFVNLYAFDVSSNPVSNSLITVDYNGVSDVNSFQYTLGSDFIFLSSSISKYNTDTQSYETGAYYFSIDPVLPSGVTNYLNEHVTSIQVTQTGQYDTCPQAIFTEYSYVDSLNLTLSNFLMSTGCTGNIPLIFNRSGNLGTGASGYLLLNQANNIVIGYSIGKSATGYSITSPGTGYTGAVGVSLNKAVYANCYDVPAVIPTDGLYPYYPFSADVVFKKNAGYMTGLTICSNEVTGQNTLYTYHLNHVSGIWITNPGSGYSSIFKPYVTFKRDISDARSGNAQATINLNSVSGIYDFYSAWQVTTGFDSFYIADITQNPDGNLLLDENFQYYFISEDSGYAFINESIIYSGFGIYAAANNNLFFKVIYNGSDYTGVQTAKLTISNERGYSAEQYFTGKNAYSSDPNLISSVGAPTNSPNITYNTLFL